MAHPRFDEMSTTAPVSQSQMLQHHQIPQQKQIPQPAPTPKSGRGGAPRHRASVACAACRDRRIRCVVPDGARECTQCQRNGTECVIKLDDERRRPVSKAYTSSLMERISLLENMLSEHGTEPPPAAHPPITKSEARGEQNPPGTSLQHLPRPAVARRESQSQSGLRNISQNRPSPKSSTEGDETDGHVTDGQRVEGAPTKRIHDPSNDGSLVERLISTRGHMTFDQLSGCLRYFGPTTNYHIYAAHEKAFVNAKPPEQARRTERIIRSLPSETHDYLMDLFWEYYNPVLHIVHKEAFNEDRENGDTKYYSGFLHICLLAIGYRYADTEREDVKKITIAHRESVLHREAKYMLDVEMERPGGLPSVQAFLLLGDLECGVGRDNTGWMFAGMAIRLCFDIGLHLDCGNEDLPEKEILIRNMTLFACVVYDKYWALFLGRPTGMKSADLEMYRLANQFSSLGRCHPAGVAKLLETQIYEELLELMEMSGKIVEIQDPRITETQAVNDNAYLQVMTLDRQLQTWYRRLPEKLTWKPANIQTAPFSYFLLHQQYHCSLILLHRPWAKYEVQAETHNPEDDFSKVDNDYFQISRSICTRQAIRVAQVFWHHRQSLDIRKCFVTGMQHAGTAATALVAALAVMKDPDERKNNMKYLERLAMALRDMGPTYHPAEAMSTILQAVMAELSESGDKPSPLESIRKVGRNQRSDNPFYNEAGEQRDSKRRASSVSSSTRADFYEFVGLNNPLPPPLSTHSVETSRVHETDRRNNFYITPQGDVSMPQPLLIDGSMPSGEGMAQQMDCPFGAYGIGLDSMHDNNMWSGGTLNQLASFRKDLAEVDDGTWTGYEKN